MCLLALIVHDLSDSVDKSHFKESNTIINTSSKYGANSQQIFPFGNDFHNGSSSVTLLPSNIKVIVRKWFLFHCVEF